MESTRHSTDKDGFDYMANSGIEEKDRDSCGMLLALGIIALLTIFQYLALY